MSMSALEQIAWADCLRWAASDEGILDCFMADTGIRPPSSALDRLIDGATGYDKKTAEEFVAWFNANVWGGDRPAGGKLKP